MKKIGLALLWIALAASLTMMFIVMGQNNALIRKQSSAAKKNETIQAQYNEAKEQLKEAISGRNQLVQQNTALTQEKTDLESKLTETSAALQEANEALAEAQLAWEQQVKTLTEEKNAADIRLAQALAVLTQGDTEEAQDASKAESLFIRPETLGAEESLNGVVPDMDAANAEEKALTEETADSPMIQEENQ